MVRHIVMIKTAAEAEEKDIEEVFSKLAELKNSIPGIVDFRAGRNNSPEGLEQGYSHLFMMDFTDKQARDAYLPHPEHKAVQPAIMSILSDDGNMVLVMDIDI